VILLDAAEGIEEQTRKFFEVCCLRDAPIIAFVTKFDREGGDPFALFGETLCVRSTLTRLPPDGDPGVGTLSYGAGEGDTAVRTG
jgi:peptide chain release factor 3